jgi:hypothetical protein
MTEIKKCTYTLEQLQQFKEYFDSLYGNGLDVANWHLNGDMESFDTFYESAVAAMNEGKTEKTEHKRKFRVEVGLDGYSKNYYAQLPKEYLKNMNDQEIVDYLSNNIDVTMDVYETTDSEEGTYLGSF